MLFPLAWLIGEQGITFLIMVVNSLLAFFILRKDKKIAIALIAITIILLSCFYYSDTAIPTGKKIKVALIQGNINRSWEWRIANTPTAILDTYRRLSLQAASDKPDIIVWQEEFLSYQT